MKGTTWEPWWWWWRRWNRSAYSVFSSSLSFLLLLFSYLFLSHNFETRTTRATRHPRFKSRGEWTTTAVHIVHGKISSTRGLSFSSSVSQGLLFRENFIKYPCDLPVTPRFFQHNSLKLCCQPGEEEIRTVQHLCGCNTTKAQWSTIYIVAPCFLLSVRAAAAAAKSHLPMEEEVEIS